MTALARPAVALAAGAVWALCFGRSSLPLASWAALAPLVLLAGAPRPGLSGWLHGVAFWLVSIPWIAPTVTTFGGLPAWLGWILLGVLAAYLGLFHALFARLGAPLWRRGGWAAGVGLPALWVALEWSRGWALGGFPWNLAAYAWVDVRGARELASWIGPYGVGALVVAVNVALAAAVRRRRPAGWLAAVGAVLVVLACGARWGGGAPSIGDLADERGAFGAGRPVVVVQPDIPVRPTWDPAASAADYRGLLELTEAACRPTGTPLRELPLVVWPESAAWPLRYPEDPPLARDVDRFAERCPLLVNTTRAAGDRFFNSAVLVADGGSRVAVYDKRELVPFGEHVPPWIAWLPGVGTLARNAGAYAAGGDAAPLEWGGERLGLSICFEVTFPEAVADSVARGATVLATITNDAWYGDSWAPYQHLRAARFRAAENRRPLVRAALTGISAFVDADGSLDSALGVGERGLLAARVAGAEARSLYTRRPWLTPAAAVAVALFAIFIAARSRPR